MNDLQQRTRPIPRLCGDTEGDAWLRDKLSAAIEFLLEEFGEEHLEAVLLVGSGSRGEASVLKTPHGHRLLGDLDLLVIARQPLRWRALRRRMHDLSSAATAGIGAEGAPLTIEYGPAGLSYLRNLQPSIFSFDLSHHAVVLWQRSDVLDMVQPIDVGAIPRIDALHLLMNRLAEILPSEPPPSPEASVEWSYQLDKVALDLAGSALAFAGRHESHYRGRAQALAALMDDDPSLRQSVSDPERLLSSIEKAAEFKLNPGGERRAASEASGTVQQLKRWALELWSWEARQLFGGAARGVSAIPDLLRAYVAHEGPQRRVRGWVKFVLHPLRPPPAATWSALGRCGLRSSPQSLAFALIISMHAGLLGESEPGWLEALAVDSPVPLSSGSEARVSREIAELWRWLVRNN